MGCYAPNREGMRTETRFQRLALARPNAKGRSAFASPRDGPRSPRSASPNQNVKSNLDFPKAKNARMSRLRAAYLFWRAERSLSDDVAERPHPIARGNGRGLLAWVDAVFFIPGKKSATETNRGHTPADPRDLTPHPRLCWSDCGGGIHTSSRSYSILLPVDRALCVENEH